MKNFSTIPSFLFRSLQVTVYDSIFASFLLNNDFVCRCCCSRYVICLLNCFMWWIHRTNYLGSSFQFSTYTCPANNETVEFSSVSSVFSHSALNTSTNCAVTQCQSNDYNCRNSQTLCFSYRTQNNTSYCGPAVDCSILTPCNGTCSSNQYACVINTCCQPQGRCLPLFLTTFCQSLGIRWDRNLNTCFRFYICW